MNPAFSNLGVMLVMMQVSRNLDFENEKTIFWVRTAYVACQIVTMAIYLVTKFFINRRNDLTTLKYVEQGSPFSGEEPKAVVITVKEYDLKEVDKQMKSLVQGLAMMGFMHLYMKYTNPLVMQSVTTVKSALESNIVKIHLFGSPATGDLKRPFKAAPGLMSAFANAQNSPSDEQSFKKAEISGAGGIKED
ncbi:uncharacterized protein PRCAT00004451001 [Priceomyces carsonii]|uniref:uncharacterized protein n=1 Tax=Priceomyces carsonii TaxID=28549 RepID=UPI002ED8F57A|nr:unnamed protein product [Priceomyces carsonii]